MTTLSPGTDKTTENRAALSHEIKYIFDYMASRKHQISPLSDDWLADHSAATNG
jgi:hypothetical protein